MHSRCMFGDVFASTSCDCARLVRSSLRAIAGQGLDLVIEEVRRLRERSRQRLGAAVGLRELHDRLDAPVEQ